MLGEETYILPDHPAQKLCCKVWNRSKETKEKDIVWDASINKQEANKLVSNNTAGASYSISLAVY